MRLGIAVVPASPWSRVVEQACTIEDAGFDVFMTGDHMRHPLDPAAEFLDGWSVLAGVAQATRHVRLAMYASNLIYRNPVLLAKQAIAVDHISDGRLDLGIGAGVFDSDHAMAGVEAWAPPERVARVEESAQILDRLLRGDTRAFAGRHYSFEQAAIAPPPVQQPRPPIVIGAQGPKMLKVTARWADRWNTFGGYGVADAEEFYALTESRSRALDRECEAIGRDPATLERSVLVHHSVFDPWTSVDAFRAIMDRFKSLGVTELLFYWPREHERPGFDDVVERVIHGAR